MPKVVDYEQRKKEITFKALEIFSKKGYSQVNLLEIAKKRKGAMYDQ